MLNKIKKGLGLSLLFVSSLCFASEHFLMPGVSIDFEFPPHSPQVLTNMFFWTLAANCRIISQDESNDIFVRMRASTGKAVMLIEMPMNKAKARKVAPGWAYRAYRK